jgi:alkanesulfonate monooxygenase SsuD/methylene tetrahydromethanopterin reductase-like flavin-dependent oxidoreductase (luciferase family)
MASSLDVITGGGRMELTLGAGDQEPHYLSYGIHFGIAGERVTTLIDAVAVMRDLWSNDSFTRQSQRLSVEDATDLPRPVRGTIPSWIGVLGPRMMRFVVREAGGWMKNRGWPESLEQLAELAGILDSATEKARRDPGNIRRVLNGAEAMGTASQTDARSLMGTAEKIIELFRGAGIDTFHLRFPEEGTEDQVQQFTEEVIAKMK